MKLKNILSLVSLIAVTWYFFKSHNDKQNTQKPGNLSRLIDGLTDEIKKPLNQIDDTI